MSTPSRSIVRPPPPATLAGVSPVRLLKLRSSLARERAAYARWFSRLMRACRAVEKSQRRIARYELSLRQAETH